MEDVNKQRRNFISLSVLGCGPKEFDKTERTQIHLLSDVFIAVASLNLKVPKLLTHRTRWQRKRFLKSEFAFFQCWSRFQLTYFVKCRRTLLKLNSWGQYPSSEREIKFHRCLFTSSLKREIRHFHVEVVQKQEGNVQKSVMHVQSCWFAY